MGQQELCLFWGLVIFCCKNPLLGHLVFALEESGREGERCEEASWRGETRKPWDDKKVFCFRFLHCVLEAPFLRSVPLYRFPRFVFPEKGLRVSSSDFASRLSH